MRSCVCASALAVPPVAGDPPFATPKGYEFRTNDPDVTCCWLWLMDADTKDADRMFEEKIDPKAKDMGPSPLYGGTEHWHKSGWFPFKTTGDWYTNNGTLLHADQYTNIPKEGDVITNTTYSDVKVGPIPESAFAHPDAKPTFGKCKQFGKDPRCSSLAASPGLESGLPSLPSAAKTLRSSPRTDRCPVHDSAKMLAEHKVLRTIFS